MTSSCILWGGKPDACGYGRSRGTYAHRRAWSDANGPIPAGFVIHHECETRLCVNPQHLRAMSRGDHDRLHKPCESRHERERARGECHAGHAYTEANTYWHEGRRHCRRCRADQARRAYRARAAA